MGLAQIAFDTPPLNLKRALCCTFLDPIFFPFDGRQDNRNESMSSAFFKQVVFNFKFQIQIFNFEVFEGILSVWLFFDVAKMSWKVQKKHPGKRCDLPSTKNAGMDVDKKCSKPTEQVFTNGQYRY